MDKYIYKQVKVHIMIVHNFFLYRRFTEQRIIFSERKKKFYYDETLVL